MDDYRNNLPLSHFGTKELFRMKEEIIKDYECHEAENLRINYNWMQRFSKHFDLESFIVSPYKIKKLVENCIALEFEGFAGEHERYKFEDKYKGLHEEFSRKFNINEKNNYSRMTWNRFMDKEKLKKKFLMLQEITLDKYKEEI